jgi:hypothetical protein
MAGRTAPPAGPACPPWYASCPCPSARTRRWFRCTPPSRCPQWAPPPPHTGSPAPCCRLPSPARRLSKTGNATPTRRVYQSPRGPRALCGRTQRTQRCVDAKPGGTFERRERSSLPVVHQIEGVRLGRFLHTCIETASRVSHTHVTAHSALLPVEQSVRSRIPTRRLARERRRCQHNPV